VARRMRAGGKGGSIIHISSQMGHVGGPERSVYCASKFALEGLTRTMALELGDAGIRVNTLCPTFIETDLTRSSLADPAFRRYVMDNIKLRRPGRLEDIMGPVVFLASEAAGLITGSALMVDGGWTAT
uniref:SDR family NAD(P)-dependent oxidoreductase n=2 Tax=Enterobacter TaxID=547 RepID=UPI0014959B41